MGDGVRGLAIEFKTPKGTGEVSIEQLRFLARLRKQGWLASVCQNYNVAVYIIDTYFKLISNDGDFLPSCDDNDVS